MYLSPTFDTALTYATHIHAHQQRKSTEIPYITHLLGVLSIALEYGATETEAIGALLHDAGEDAGGAGRIADITLRFGAEVAAIVAGCSDTLEEHKPDWRTRKEAYIAHLSHTTPSIRFVSCADKLHNARAILRDHYRIGDQVFERFTASKAETLWYYRALTTAFQQAQPSGAARELVEELDRTVSILEQRGQGVNG